MQRHAPRLLTLVAAAGLLTATVTLGPVRAAAEPTAAPSASGAPSGQRLGAGAGLYPRLIELAHSGRSNGQLVASTVTFDGDAGTGAIFVSRDRGRSFQRVGTVRDPDALAGRGLCCATLYELPRRIGSLPAGTLLWSASIGQAVTENRRMSIRVYASTDHGRSWNYLSTPATAANNGGLWEPEFSVDRSGRLVVFFSDETDQPAHSQIITSARSRDGRHWSGRTPVVAGTDPDARPGMPIVRHIAAGHGNTYLMTYEVCGARYRCRVHHRSSSDGQHWGRPSDLGPEITAVDQTRFEHAPTFTWAPTRRNAKGPGRLYLVGQVLVDPDGTPAAGNGRTVLVSDRGPNGPWRPTAAPVTVPAPYDNYCPNYSSPLLTLGSRHRGSPTLLEVASGYDDQQICAAYVGAARAG